MTSPILTAYSSGKVEYKGICGPNWIHGTDDNPILELANQTNTKLHAWEERAAVFNQHGRLFPFSEAKEITESFWGIIMDAFKYSNDHSAAIPASRSLWDFIQEKAKQQYHNLPDAEAERKREDLLQVSEMWGAFTGSPVQKQSLKFFWLEECIEGENPFCAETYYKILHRIAEPVAKADIIRYGHKVTSVVCSGSEEAPQISVETSNGQKHAFDEVVVTTPLGWLKRNVNVFSPPLPLRLQQAIHAIGYGNLDKVYITFPTAFWDVPLDNEESISSTTHDNPLKTVPNTTATTAPLHQSSDPSKPASPCFAGFIQWATPHYAPDNPQHWNQEGINLAALSSSCAHPTLLFYVFGSCALHIAEIAASTPPAQQTEIITKFFQPYFSRLPNYDAASADCTPVEALATVWANDEHAGYGSYSNFPVGIEEADRDIEVMREGVPERGLWFAGEHTAPFIALGTVTGAWWSGEGVAGRICKLYGMKEENVVSSGNAVDTIGARG
ncbi:MAG: hypothetical protein M1821_007116 [Bathelium mastoideum]|nr:MAG: hypothetical protein M1821_007116 [Bathelium mastoideum]